MIGHLLLDCARREDGQTKIARQSFRAPLHLSKPYWDGSFLIINMVNPTAGLFPGDQVEMKIHVRSGANVVLTSPSASRIHPGKTGKAVVRQYFEIEKGAWLDFCPEPLIPHRNSRYAQETVIDLSQGAGLFFTEMWAPGRVSSSEAFAFDVMKMRTMVRLDGQVVALENYYLASEESFRPLRTLYENSYYASCFLLSDHLPISENFQRLVHRLSSTDALVTASSLTGNLCSIRIIAGESIALKKAALSLRSLIYEKVGKCPPLLRKL